MRRQREVKKMEPAVDIGEFVEDDDLAADDDDVAVVVDAVDVNGETVAPVEDKEEA